MKRIIWISGIIVLVLIGIFSFVPMKTGTFQPTNVYEEPTNTITANYDSEESNYEVTIGTKESCVNGQEGDPIKQGNLYIVEIYDEHCRVIDTKTCVDDNKHQFIKEKGIWTCEKK